MLRVYMVSGDELAAIPVTAVSDVRDLKQQLQKHCGVPRFRQRLLRNGDLLEDHVALDAAGNLQLVLLPFAPELQDPNLLAGGAGTTALHRAAAAGHRDVARLLLEAGADHDPPSRNLGRTPLHMAVDNGHASVVELLMDAGWEKSDSSFGWRRLVSLKSLKLEILQASEKPGMGCSAQVEDVKISAATEETEPLALSPEQLWGMDALASQTPNVKAEVVLGSVCLECEPSKIRAASLLRPCTSDTCMDVHSESRVGFKATGSEPGLVGSVSSRAVWRLQRALRGLAKAAEATSSDQTSKAAVLAASRRELAMEKRRERVDASMEKVRALFEKLDADRSGHISASELRELLENMYGKFMAPQEIDMAVSQLLRSRGGADRSLSFDELKSFFQRDSGPQAEQDHICLELQELTKPLPKKFQATAVFDDLLASMKDSKAFSRANIAAETLQLYWVRTLRNYAEAKRLWQELLAPSLEPHLKYWALRGTMPATDFWSDPAISLRALPHTGQEKQKDLTIHLSVTTDGFSIRLADTQHASSVPRAKLDISDLKLEGALFRAAGSTDFEAAASGFRGGLQLSAEYWNQTQRLSEPFVEPWSLRLEATRELFALRAEKHLVLNLTPPLLQALTVAINSLSLASDEKASTFEDTEEAKPIAVWVFNRTQCDVRICARSPEGERSSPVEISRWSFDAPVALELAAGAAEEAMGDANSRWILELEVRGGDADTSRTGEGWWVRQELPFSTTGRRLFPVGPRHLAVQFSVDVRTLAPVVSLSGICMLQNMTSQPLSVDLGVDATGTSITAAVKPYETWHAGIGGGYEVSMPKGSDQGSFKMKLPLDTTPLDDEQILLARSAGYRYVLLPPDARIRPGSVRDRVVVCVPMLSVLNALPCELSCTVQSIRKTKRRRRMNQFLNAGDPSMQGTLPPEPVEEEPPRPTGHTQDLVPGQRLGFNEVDPELAVQVVVRMAGFTYTAVAMEAPSSLRLAAALGLEPPSLILRGGAKLRDRVVVTEEPRPTQRGAPAPALVPGRTPTGGANDAVQAQIPAPRDAPAE
eukprot:s9_g13.t1